jgi:hypothetical protein|tara:strand:+ start:493 stop:1050 length:558 start_codon:yes stop_codon:yes gene_type:complete
MSKILVDTIDTRSGTSTLTLGSTNAGTIALGSGDVQSNFMYPAFRAYLNGDQNVSDNTPTKVAISAEDFDTDGNFDHSTNYRFTPTVAGKYFVFGQIHFANSSSEEIHQTIAFIEKNGTELIKNTVDPHNGSKANQTANYLATLVDMNGSTDYLELWGQIDVGSGTPLYGGGTTKTWFGAYRIGT